MAMITWTLMAPLVGGLIDRFGPRRVIAPGILILAIGLMICSRIESLAQFYIFYGVVAGTGISCIGIVSYSAILAHWFEKNRGLASGIAVSGMGLGTFLLVPMSQSFISMWGWRMTFIITGCLVLIILVPANALFLRHKPQELGQHPDGFERQRLPEEEEPRHTTVEPTSADLTIIKAFQSRNFWALIFFTSLSMLGIFIIIVHSVKFLVDQGVDKMTAAFIFAMVGVISSIFRILWGWLSDRISREITYTIGIVCACMGVSSLLLYEAYGLKLFAYSFSILFGMGWGVTAPMFISVSADLFKGKIFGLIYGFVEAVNGLAAAIGAWIGGFFFDKAQSYQMAFVFVIVAFLFSCIFIWLAAPRKFMAIR
jgi:MFS family permease